MSAQAEAPQGKADVIDVKGPANFRARLFIDSQTHLPIMLTWQAPAPPARGGGPPPGGPPAAAASRSSSGCTSPTTATSTDCSCRSAFAAPRRGDHRGNHVRSVPHQRDGSTPAIRSQQARAHARQRSSASCVLIVATPCCSSFLTAALAQQRARRHAARHRRRRDRRGHRRRDGHRDRHRGRRPRPPRRAGARHPRRASRRSRVSCRPLRVRRRFRASRRGTLPDVRVRTGDNQQVMMLPIEGHQGTVVVEPGPPGGGRGSARAVVRHHADARAARSAVGRSRRAAPAAAGHGGPGAVIRVDSFEGGALPPKAQIRSIRISRDQFAAENHSAGGTQIEIITQPGLGPIRMNTGIADAGRRARAAAARSRRSAGPSRIATMFLGAGGTLIKNKSSFNLFVDGTDSFETPNINVALGGRTRSEALVDPIAARQLQRQRPGRLRAHAGSDAAVRLRTSTATTTATSASARSTRKSAPTRPRPVATTYPRAADRAARPARLHCARACRFAWTDSESRSAVEAPTIRVNDAFTSGGAQMAGGQHSRTVGFGSDLDYVRGNHTIRTGLQVDAARWRSDDTIELSRHLHLRKPRRVPRRPAAQLHAAHRRSEHPLRQLQGGALRCRTMSASGGT